MLGNNSYVIQGEAYIGSRHLGTFAGETSVVGSTPSNGAPLTLAFSDWLGTERARASSAGSLCETTTSLPYGDSVQTSGSCAPTSAFFTGKRCEPSHMDQRAARGEWLHL